MATATPAALMTFEQMLALPENGRDYQLIRGELRETPMTKRNRRHSRVEARVTTALEIWLETQPGPRGEVVSGEAGFRLCQDPDTGVGIDVAYVSAQVATLAPDAPYFQGPPVLAVEILSPSDTQESIDEKVGLYLEFGVVIVWVINPRFRTITVFRPGAEPVLFNAHQEITAEPHLPGFQVAVARLFGD